MPNIPIRMPQTLIARDNTTRHAVQVGRGVRGYDANALEVAIAHLAAGRVHSPPASMRYYSIGTNQQTFNTRIANPIVPEWAVVYAMLGADDYTTGTMSASSDTTGLTTYTTRNFEIGGGLANAIVIGIEIEIGTGAVEAPSYEAVRMLLDADTTGAYLHSWGVITLPHAQPFSDGAV